MEKQISTLLREFTQKNGDLLQCCQIPLEHFMWNDNLMEKALVISSSASEIQQTLDELHAIGESMNHFQMPDSQIQNSLFAYLEITEQLSHLTEAFDRILMQDLLESCVLEALTLKEEIRMLQWKVLQKQTEI